jgi:nuclear pore complex protein Nup62
LPALKHKSLEDILNKWSSDLDTYTKEFHRQAVQVIQWDKSLIQHGTKVQKLYQEIQALENVQNDVDANLSYIGSQQDELSAILDNLEKKVSGMFDLSSSEGEKIRLNPADEQREKTFTQAEVLSKQLEDMNIQLSDIVKELNVQSGPEEGGSLDTIVKILNHHLTCLVDLDASTNELQTMLAKAEAASMKMKENTKRMASY